MKRLVLGAAAALVLTVGQASAEGLGPVSRISDGPFAPSWSGFYVGVGVGAGATVTDVALNHHHHDFELFGLDGVGAEGVFGTVSIGYDHQIHPNWVLGVFADYDFGSSISTDVTFFNHTNSIDQNYAWAVGGRVGYLTSPSTMFYGTAGYTETELEAFDEVSETFNGYFVGAGMETMLRPNWSLKLEYRFSQYDEVKYGDDCFNLTVEPSEHSARLVLSYKLGGRDGGSSIKD